MSYETYRSIDSLRTEYLKNIDTYECLLKAWDAVTFNYKKDGGHFASLQKNFNGARVMQCNYSADSAHKELHVTCWTNKCGYKSDYIELYQRSGSWKVPDTLLPVDEIIEKINKRKATLAGYIAGYQYKLDNLDTLKAFEESVQAAVDSLPKQLRSDATYMLKGHYFHS